MAVERTMEWWRAWCRENGIYVGDHEKMTPGWIFGELLKNCFEAERERPAWGEHPNQVVARESMAAFVDMMFEGKEEE